MKNDVWEGEVARHVFSFNPGDNGGGQLTLVSHIIDNGDVAAGIPKAGVFLNQELSLQSYGNSASFLLFGASLTPNDLRRLANELEGAMVQAQAKIQARVKPLTKEA
jgi:hypothetical protein